MYTNVSRNTPDATSRKLARQIDAARHRDTATRACQELTNFIFVTRVQLIIALFCTR